MENKSLKRMEKILRRIFAGLAVVTVAGIILLIRFGTDKPEAPESLPETAETEEITEEYDWEAGLSDATYWLPEYCNLYDALPEITFTDTQGQSHSVKEWQGTPVVLVFWASWCEDCKEQMPHMAEYEKTAEKYGDIPFLYLNKTDGEKETRETAEAYFKELGLQGDYYLDESLQAYHTLGIHNIPTTLFLNQEGRIAAWSPRQIEKQEEFEALLKNAVEGSSKATAEFVAQSMMQEKGGIVSQYHSGKTDLSKEEVLSESQGLYLLYAAEAGEKEAFDKAFSFVKNEMWQEGLAAWQVSEGEASKVNALIDDFRIYRALQQARQQWGGYEEELALCESALQKYGMQEGYYVDFYDRENKEYADRFTLCYGDLEAMQLLMKGNEKSREGYENALAIMEQGQISNEFPLYYSWYNYDKKRYEKDELNMAEAMMTLLQLARQDKLKSNTVKWLKEQLAGEGIWARYTVDGEVVDGYEYESTAVYAIVAMIADEIGDNTLRGQALKKMEKMHITDVSLPYNGAFGMEDGSGITSFDQLMPMLAYQQAEAK